MDDLSKSISYFTEVQVKLKKIPLPPWSITPSIELLVLSYFPVPKVNRIKYFDIARVLQTWQYGNESETIPHRWTVAGHM